MDFGLVCFGLLMTPCYSPCKIAFSHLGASEYAVPSVQEHYLQP